MVRTAIFNSIKDNSTDNKMSFESYDEFEEWLFFLSNKPGFKPSKDDAITQRCSKLISPAQYLLGEKRRNVNVTHWGGWCALDVDAYEGTPNEAVRLMSPYRFTCYSTASSTKAHPKFRVVFPLTHDVPSEKIKHFWYALNMEMGSVGDKQTKDLSRLYYIPGKYPNAFNFIFANKRPSVTILNPFTLMQKHAYVEKQNDFLSHLPPEMREQLMAQRRNQLTNTGVNWTSYRDCPFVSMTALRNYRAIRGEGWYHGFYKLLVSIACTATKQKYPLTSHELAGIAKGIDVDNGNWYNSRPIDVEASRAIEFALANTEN
jgi:hypothetical protein